MVVGIMAASNRNERREKLLVDRADCLARMTDSARRAFEQRANVFREEHDKHAPGVAPTKCAEGPEPGQGALLAQEIRNLIGEVHRLRRIAERRLDIRTAIKGLDTALKALQLYGRATGEIREQGVASVIVNAVATRDEGVQIAADVLLDLATAAELVPVITQLQQRLAELSPLQGEPKSALPVTVEPLQPLLLPAPTDEKTEEEKDG